VFVLQQSAQMRKVHADISARFDVHEELGRGGYGVVYKATDTQTMETCALKRSVGALSTKTDALRALREVYILRDLGSAEHPYLVRLITALRTTHDKDRDLYLAFEFCDADLGCALEKGLYASRDSTLGCLTQIVFGVAHLHQRGILHRDLKPENILVKQSGAADDMALSIRIADFGLACAEASIEGRVDVDEYESSPGTLHFMAPEILLEVQRHTFASDIWAVGLIFGELLSGRPLVRGTSVIQVLGSILSVIGLPSNSYMELLEADQMLPAVVKLEHASGHIPQDAGSMDFLQDLLSLAEDSDIHLFLEMMEVDYCKRPTALEVLQYDSVKEFADADDKARTILACPWEALQIPMDGVDQAGTKKVVQWLYTAQKN